MTRVSLIVAHDESGVIAVDGPHEARAVVELTVARGAGRRWASYALDGLVRRGHGVPTAWTPDAPPTRRDGRALWAAWCLHRDRAIVRDAARAHAVGRSVRVLALVAPWSATHGTAYTVARAEAAGLEVDVRRFGG